MAQPGQIPINPMVPTMAPIPVPVPAPIPVQEFVRAAAIGKRRREDAPPHPYGIMAEGEVSASSKRAKGMDVLFRIVVPSKQIGKVIGKEGCRIQRIREDTKAAIKIADAIAYHEERVIIISSKQENENSVTDAEKALLQIAALILMEDGSSSSEVLKIGAVHMAANTIRLLIAGSQAGSLIGMSGENIEKLRNLSGATIAVLAPNQLPLCASAHESDRVVQISGDVHTVLKALEEIGTQLRENPPQQVISINPTYNYNTIQPFQPYSDPTSADYVTFAMLISETMVGGLIGRSGSNISRIRNESGATIKVFGGKGEQKLRQIQFGGTVQQVALAKQRVDQYIYSQLILDGQQQSLQGL